MNVELIAVVVAALSIILLLIGAGAARRGDPRSLTLLRVVGRGVVCVAAAFLVFAVFFCHTTCGPSAQRNRTTAIHRAITSGLENYRSEFGEFPEPVRRGKTLRMDGQTYEADAALMLYQVLSGDGNDAIVMSGNDKHSDGRWEEDERKKMFLVDMPKLTEAGYIIVDGYGHPFQYDRSSPGRVDVANSTFDLWSFNDSPPVSATKKTKIDTTLSARWIKNW